MKTFLNFFAAGILLLFFVGCSCDCPELKDCQKKLADCQNPPNEVVDFGKQEVDSSMVIPEAAYDVNGISLQVSPIGRLSDGNSAGYNISVEYLFGKVTVKALYTDGQGGVKVGPAYDLVGNDGVEVYLGGTNPDIYIVKVDSRFTGHSIPLTLAGSNPAKFDCKVSKSCRAINPTTPASALVGVNDARTAGIAKSNGIIGNLSGGNRVRIHADELVGYGYNVVFSTDSLKIQHQPSYAFSDLGVPRWGSLFDVSHP